MWDDFHSTVADFMRDYSTPATLLKGSEEYDPTTGTQNSTTQEIPVEVILMDLTLQSNGLSTKYQTLVEAGDKEAFVRPNKDAPFKIEPADRLLVNGVEYKVVTVKEVNPTTSDPIIFDLYLRV